MDRGPAKEAIPFDAVLFLVNHESIVDLGVCRREYGSDDDNVNDDGMRPINLPADAFIARTIFFVLPLMLTLTLTFDV